MPTSLFSSLKFRPAVLALLLIVALPLSAHAQWKWRDAAGKVQYSDLPPPQGTPEQDILQRPPTARKPVVVRPVSGADSASVPASAAASAPRQPNRAELEAQAKRKQAEAEIAARRKEEERKIAEQRAENCRRATEHLNVLESGVRITKRNAAGETIFLDDQQRTQEIQYVRGIMASDCR
jgi:hypothetical protein